ncbi:hypothetical protein L7F22_066910 [Adiantum nelumboides]|nr:hypothetical protein [Adiantum nelumboides]
MALRRVAITRSTERPDLKIACPIFKGKKHDDLDVHIQAFEYHAELKHILEEEWGEYFPHTLKEATKKWYYHYPASKLQAYNRLKKAFILEYTDDGGDEDILCELDKIKQGKLSVRKYVQKIKELTRRLNEPPSEKKMRALFLSGFNNRKLRDQEVPTPTKKITELMHRALKLEQQAKKERSRHRSKSESSISESIETEKSSSSSSKSSEDDRKKKKRLNPKAKEWEQSKSTWKEKGKAKEFDEWKAQRELAAAKTTENLEKKKPEILECSEARVVQRILVAVTKALLLETQTVDAGSIPIDSSEDNSDFENEQDEIEVQMGQRI